MNDDDILLTQRQVQRMRGDCSGMTIYRDVKRGILPEPIKLNGRNHWRLKDVRRSYRLDDSAA